MANLSTFSRSGVVNNTSDGSFGQDNALFLKVFSGEILTAFEENNVMKGLHRVRTIGSGKSAQFPVTGIASAKYHEAGKDLMTEANGFLSDIAHAERTINIDDVLIASTFLANIDELKNHFDVRSIYAKELGKALAKRFDLATMKTLIAAAKDTSAIYTGAPTGQTLAPNYADPLAPTAGELIGSLMDCAQSLDEKDVSSDGRFALLEPADYYTLVSSDNAAINKDTSEGGSVTSGRIASIGGIRLIKTNHLKDVTVDNTSAALAADDLNANNAYNADISATRFVVGTPEAIGTVKLLDLATESEYQIQRQGHLFVAKYAMGHGVLRPECAIAVDPT